jgi:nucleotide-binding universal stress UspA family protein
VVELLLAELLAEALPEALPELLHAAAVMATHAHAATKLAALTRECGRLGCDSIVVGNSGPSSVLTEHLFVGPTHIPNM